MENDYLATDPIARTNAIDKLVKKLNKDLKKHFPNICPKSPLDVDN